MPVAREIAMRTHMSVELARDCVEAAEPGGACSPTGSSRPCPARRAGNFFTLPDEVFYLAWATGRSRCTPTCSAVRTAAPHQCHPSYNTIAAATGLAVNTVMKHIRELADRQFVAVERTSYLDRRGMKWNGNNLYTILPIQQAVDGSYRRQLAELELSAERRRVVSPPAGAGRPRVTACGPLCGPMTGGAGPLPLPGPFRTIWGEHLEVYGGRRPKQDKRRGRKRPRRVHNCPQCGQLRETWSGVKPRGKSVFCGHSARGPADTRKKRGSRPGKEPGHEQEGEIRPLSVAGEEGPPGAAFSGGWKPEPHRLHRAGD